MNGKTQECAVKTILLKGKEFNNRLAAFQVLILLLSLLALLVQNYKY